jgi:TIR domain
MKSVFISHIHEDAHLASALKQAIEGAFLGQCTVFVSSDSESIPAGARWFSDIDAALSSASVLLVLCSRRSIQRPWVNFEAGAGFARKLPIIPICHSNLTKADLPLPLSTFQSVDLTSAASLPVLWGALAKYLEFPRTPHVHPTATDAVARALVAVLKFAAPPDGWPLASSAAVSVAMSENDQIAVLKDYLNHAGKDLHIFQQVDSELALPPGSVKKYLARAGSEWFDVDIQGESTIRFKPKDYN